LCEEIREFVIFVKYEVMEYLNIIKDFTDEPEDNHEKD
jgi:hypothetical protein